MKGRWPLGAFVAMVAVAAIGWKPVMHWWHCRQLTPKYDGSQSGPAWLETVDGACMVYAPSPEDGRSIQWSGGCEECAAEGQGILTFRRNGRDAGRFDGPLVKGAPSGESHWGMEDGTEYKGGLGGWSFQGQGALARPDGTRYRGSFASGAYDGKGELILPGGGRYVGSFRSGKYEGDGELALPGNVRYVGSWSGGQYSGKGELSPGDGSRYVGEFVAGAQHGAGVLTWPDGRVQEGRWVDGKPDCSHVTPKYAGKSDTASWLEVDMPGCYVLDPFPTDAETATWTGGCKDCRLTGKGLFTWFEKGTKGTSYSGAMVEGAPDGEGREYKMDGSVYIGSFKGWHYEGEGEYKRPDGFTYVGGFRAGKIHGQGRLTRASGDTEVGEFRDGSLVSGAGTKKYSNGDSYSGDMQGGLRNGQGIYYFADGGRYSGSWQDDHRNGQGRMTYADGSSYDGEWKDGARDGQGTMSFADGGEFTGQFEEDFMRDPELAESALLEDCRSSLAVADPAAIQLGPLVQGYGSTPESMELESQVANGTPVPIRITLNVTVTPSQRESGAIGVGVGVWALLTLVQVAMGNDLADSAEQAVPGGLLAGASSAESTRDSNASRTASGSVYVEAGGTGILKVSTGYFANGIESIVPDAPLLEWPEGKMRDPTGCLARWKLLWGSGRADAIRAAYRHACDAHSALPVCDYLEAVDKGNSVDALRSVAREYDDETMTAVATARADVLELLATLAQ